MVPRIQGLQQGRHIVLVHPAGQRCMSQGSALLKWAFHPWGHLCFSPRWPLGGEKGLREPSCFSFQGVIQEQHTRQSAPTPGAELRCLAIRAERRRGDVPFSWAEKAVEKPEPSCTAQAAGGKVRWYSHLGRQSDTSSRVHRVTV